MMVIPFIDAQIKVLGALIQAIYVQSLEKTCPRLPLTSYRLTSLPDPAYNCIAWAADDMAHWWWPRHPLASYTFWPAGLPNHVTIENFQRAYESVGYSRCDGASVEKGVEKIAIYAVNRVPTHAARQLPSGRWTSKCGKSYDIEHLLPEDLGGGAYGDVVLYMSRPRSSTFIKSAL